MTTTYRLSSYVIFTALENSGGKYMLVHGYTGAIDIAPESIVAYLRSPGPLSPEDTEVCRSHSAADGSPVYTVAGVPAEGIYGLFDKHSGRTYHRRIFYFRKGTVRRF